MKKFLNTKAIAFIVVLIIVTLFSNYEYALDDEIIDPNSILNNTRNFEDGFVLEKNNDGDNTYTITKYDSTIATNIIPSTIKGHTITRIADNAYKNCDRLYGVVKLPDTIISIGNSAFYGCNKMQEVRFGENIESVGNSAFYGCKQLENVTLNDKLQTIGNESFRNCTYLRNGNGSLVIPSSVRKIGSNAFNDTFISFMYFNSKSAPILSKNALTNQGMTIFVPNDGIGYTKENNWPVDSFAKKVKGDLTGNGVVDSADASLALDIFKRGNATTDELKYGDMDGNGIIDSRDASAILDVFKNGVK